MSDLIYPYPARVITARATDLESMLALAKQKMPDPSMLDNATPFFWSAEISNNSVDAYFTHMLPSTLQNFATDAEAGVSFLNSHRHNELPFGRSLSGNFEQMGEGQRVTAGFYTLPGLNLNGIKTDDFIAGMRAGIIKDVSVGFYGGQMWCDVCRANYNSWDCPHIAGAQYEIQGGGKVTATVGVDNARLAEVSGVYDGATPDATILKAERMIAAGELKPDAIYMLEQRYRRNFTTKKSFQGVSLEERVNKPMDFEKIVNQVREVLNLQPEDDIAATVLSLTTERAKLIGESEANAKELTELRAKVQQLEPQAKDGEQYRSDLIAEALAEGVRALGANFKPETYQEIMRGAPLAIIKQMRADWAVVGNANFPGGRSTVDNSEAPQPEEKQQPRRMVPESAYQS